MGDSEKPLFAKMPTGANPCKGPLAASSFLLRWGVLAIARRPVKLALPRRASASPSPQGHALGFKFWKDSE